MLAAGLLCGIAASVLFNLGIALQAIEARSAPAEEGLRVSLLVLLAVGSRILGERPGPDVLLGVIAIIAGVALIAWGAPPHDEQHRGPVAVVVVMAAMVGLSLVPFALRGTRLDGALVPNLGSACGFAATNVAAKLMADDIGGGHCPEAVGWLAVAGFAGVAATITGMTALQRRPATTVVPISTAVQTFLPVALEPLFLTESWRAAELGGFGLLAGLLVLLLGTALVARAHSVSTLAAGSAG
ncbi:MAG: hypothetical protein ACOYD4_13660 [Solirubrobacterales bacterium]